MCLFPEENQKPVWGSHRFSEEKQQFSLDVKQKYTNTVLGLLDGPTGCVLAFCVVWFRFLFRRYLALWHSQVGRAYRHFEMVGEGCLGHGPIHLPSTSAAEIGFRWNPVALAWVRPGLPMLSNLAGPIQHFKAAVLDAWRNKAAADLCGRGRFSGRAIAGCSWLFAAP